MADTRLRAGLVVCLEAAAAAAMPEQPDVRLGIDLVEVSEVERSVAVFGAAYLDRVFTAGEVQDAGGRDATPVELAPRLAARFAAKEAVTKALAPADAPGWWREIEVVRQPSGAPALVLTGRARAAALSAGITRWGLSMTHESGHAAAVVVGERAGHRWMSEQEGVSA